MQLYPKLNNIYNSVELGKLNILSEEKFDINDSEATSRKL